MLKSKEPFRDGQFGPETPRMEVLRQIFTENPDLTFDEDEMAYLMEGELEGMQNVAGRISEFNTEVRQVMADTSVFCLSETHDNLLMWSHYAGNHEGAVIQFLPVLEVDSPLILAEPVRYSADLPRLRFAALLDHEEAKEAVAQSITLTKSAVWSYEKEWRVVTAVCRVLSLPSRAPVIGAPL